MIDVIDVIDEGSSRYFIDDNNQLIEVETGEVILQKDIKRAYQEQVYDLNDHNTEALREVGINLDLKITKFKGVEYPVVTIKKNYTFRKVFVVSVRDAMKELSKNAKIFIATFQPYIYFPHNSVVVDSRHPSVEDMCEMMDLKKSAVYNALNELEQKDIITKNKINGDLIIHFNPFLYCSGGVIHRDTYAMFKNSIYNPRYIDSKEQRS